jgi:formylglycine-generating enzyme required for sulfatase activity
MKPAPINPRSISEVEVGVRTIRWLGSVAVVAATIVGCECLPEDVACDSPTRGSGLDEERCVTGGTYTIGADAIPILPHMIGANGGPCTALEVGTAACNAVYLPAPYNDWAPKHQVWLSPFFIDTFEVTYGRYRECVTAGACGYRGGELNPPLDNPLFADSPVAEVTWRNANDYCRWREKRLPTEAEWESAGRGKKAFQWPWGDTPKSLIFSVRPTYPAAAVGGNEVDVSPFGVHDLQWGVEEWVSDWYGGPYPDDTRLVKNPQGPGEPQVGFIKCCKEDDWRRMFGWSADKSIRGTTSTAMGGYELDAVRLDSDYPLWVRAHDSGFVPGHGEGSSTYVGFRCARDGRMGQTSQGLESVPTHHNLSWEWYGKGRSP